MGAGPRLHRLQLSEARGVGDDVERTMGIEISVTRTREPKSKPDPAALGFGRYFSDHMFVMNWAPEEKWHAARVVPYGTLGLEPAAAVFHYGQAIFEGNKAFRGDDGAICFFRLAEP